MSNRKQLHMPIKDHSSHLLAILSGVFDETVPIYLTDSFM